MKKKPTIKKINKEDLPQFGWGGGLQGFASGAASGASAGMAAGPWGALAGAVIGGGIGAYTGSTNEDKALAEQKRLEAQQAQQLQMQQQQLSNPAYQSFAHGGIQNSYNPNAEVEREEVVRMPNGATAQVDGPSHQNGGVPVNIPNGTQIFSDRLKMPGTKTTFAKLAEKYKVNKEEKVINDDKVSSLSKSTAKINMELKQRKLSEIFNAQESLKDAKMQKYAQRVGAKFPNGGTKLPQYPGLTKDGLPTPGTFWDQQTGMDNPVNAGVNKYQLADESLNTPDSFNLYTPQSNSNFSVAPGGTRPTQQQLSNQYEQEILAGKHPRIGERITGNTSPKSLSETPLIDGSSSNNSVAQGIGAVANLAGPLYNLATNKKPKPFEYAKPTVKQYDPTQALNDSARMARLNQYQMRNAAAGNSAAYLASRAVAGAAEGQNRSDIRSKYDQMNVGTFNQMSPLIADIKNKNTDAMQADQARYRDINRQAVSNLGENVTGNYKDRKSGEMDQYSLDIIGKAYPDYSYNKDKRQWEHKVTKAKLKVD